MGTYLPSRKGFTLVEAAVGVAIAAVLSFALYLTIGGTTASTSAAGESAKNASSAAVSLFDIVTAIAALETTNPPVSYLQTVGAYPSALSQLTTQITTADRNSCDRPTDVYSGAAPPAIPGNPGYVQGWSGPYVITNFPAGSSTQIAPGFVAQDDMIRIPANPPNNPKADEWSGRLLIRMPAVSQANAQALDAAVDFTINGASGTVRYTAADPTVLDYEIRVSRC